MEVAILATPGRLVDHLENTKGFNLRALKYLVLDEADRILNMDFEVELDKILKVIPKERKTYLYSATMTKKVKKIYFCFFCDIHLSFSVQLLYFFDRSL